MMGLGENKSAPAFSGVLLFVFVSYALYFNAVEAAHYFFLFPSFVGSLFSGYDPVSSFSSLTQAASLGNVVRFDAYVALSPSVSIVLKNAGNGRNIIIDGPQIASGTAIIVEVTASDVDGIDIIQYADTGSPSTYFGSQSCAGVTPCTRSWTITPAVGSWTFDADAPDTTGAWGDALDVGPISVVNSCAGWTCPSLSAGENTANLPSISNDQYVNYVNCAATCTCPTNYKIEITASGTTESSFDFFKIGGACAGVYSPVSGGPFNFLFNSCGTQNASVEFTSDYSNHNYAGVSVTNIKCVSTDTTAPTTTDNSDANWHSNDVTVTLTCTDNPGGVGCDKTYYCIDTSGLVDCSPTTLGTSVTVTQIAYVRYYSTDLNGNTESIKESNYIRIDKNNPTSVFEAGTPADGSWVRSGFDITVTDADTGESNLATCKYNVCSDASGAVCNLWTIINGDRITASCTGSSITSTKTVTVGSAGNCQTQGTDKCQVQAWATDNAGRASTLIWRTYKIDYSAPTSQVTALSETSAETFDVSWASVDNPLIGGSGVKCVSLQYKINVGLWTDWYTCKPSSGTVTLPDGILTPVAGNTYYFKSKADDNANNDEGYPASEDTSTKVVGPPGLESPSPSGSDITLLTPTLDWSAATGANCYDVQVCTDASCAGLTLKDEAIVNDPLTSYSVPSNKLAWQTSYIWKVWPSATSCTSYRSPAQWSFNTKLPAPVINSPPSPVDGGTTSITPSLEWQRSGDADCYKLEFAKPDLTTTTRTINSALSTITYIVSPALDQGITYTWRVKPSNNACSTFGASSNRTFTTAGACSDVNNPCGIFPPSLVGSTPLTYNGQASAISTFSPGWWKLTLPSQYHAYSPTPYDSGMRDVESYDITVTSETQSGSVSSTVKVGLTSGGVEICSGSSSCSSSVSPGIYYIKIESSLGSGTVYPKIYYKLSYCGVGTPISDPVSVGSCSVTISPYAWDLHDKDVVGDYGAGRYKTIENTTSSRTTEFDDSPSGGCDMDVKFKGIWSTSGNTITIKNEIRDYDALHVLYAGYRLTSPDCRIMSCSPTGQGGCTIDFPYQSITGLGTSSVQHIVNGMSYYDVRARAYCKTTYGEDYCSFSDILTLTECNPAENTNTAGLNNFCVSKNPNIPYCDPNLKKCEPCSIVNNDPSNATAKPNINDCGVNPADLVTIGKCTLDIGASVGGLCSYDIKCDINNDCSTSCCSAMPQTSGPERITPQTLGNKCITPASPNNPMSSINSPVNSYLCKNV